MVDSFPEKSKGLFSYFFCATVLISPSAFADSNEELAKKLSNPVASLISLPIEYDYNKNIGPNDDGVRHTLTIKPVIPITLNDDWNIISRTIVPLVHQEDIAPGSGSQSGLSDIFQSVFFSPQAPTEGGWIWGAGPALLIPTATDDLLGSEKWATGPTGVVLKQSGPWTIGALVHHVWSFAGESSRSDINESFLQPFLSYTTPSAITFNVNTESTYNWENEEWTVPINAKISKVTKFGDQLVSIGGRVRYWAETTNTSPEGFGFRLEMTFLFPK